MAWFKDDICFEKYNVSSNLHASSRLCHRKQDIEGRVDAALSLPVEPRNDNQLITYYVINRDLRNVKEQLKDINPMDNVLCPDVKIITKAKGFMLNTTLKKTLPWRSDVLSSAEFLDIQLRNKNDYLEQDNYTEGKQKLMKLFGKSIAIYLIILVWEYVIIVLKVR